MKQVDRAMQLSRILLARRHPVSLTNIQAELGCSERTALRLLARLRDTFRVPVAYDRAARGWSVQRGSDAHELPGLWFTPAELYAFMVSQQLLTELQPGVFDEHLNPIRQRIETLLKQASGGCPDLARRVRILPVAARAIDANHIRVVASALLERKQLRVGYRGRSRNETTQRTLSPQPLVYYRSNWYLDALCPLRKSLRSPWMAKVRKAQEQYFRRSFSLDRLHTTAMVNEPAREIPDAQLDRHFSAGYGIFARQPKATARLRFSPDGRALGCRRAVASPATRQRSARWQLRTSHPLQRPARTRTRDFAVWPRSSSHFSELAAHSYCEFGRAHRGAISRRKIDFIRSGFDRVGVVKRHL